MVLRIVKMMGSVHVALRPELRVASLRRTEPPFARPERPPRCTEPLDSYGRSALHHAMVAEAEAQLPLVRLLVAQRAEA